MKRVLILGGGFGGLAAAHRLRSILPADDAEIVLADRRTHFFMGFHKVSWVVGREKPGDGSRPLAALNGRGIRFVNGAIDSIEPEQRAAVIAGERIEADVLLVALGADVVAGGVPGLAEHGISIYDADGATRAASALAEIQQGRVAIGIFGAPYKCPPAPFELALLAHDAAAAANKKLSFSVFSPLPMSLPALGPAGCNPLESKIAMLGIEFRPNAKAEKVEPGRVVLAGGAGAVPFDLLLAVPPHKCPNVAADAGLTGPSGWIKVNPRTMHTPFEGVYAVGDATGIPLSNGQALPKAGAIAEQEAIVAAERIAAHLQGRESTVEFSGEGSCYLEVGGGEAMLVTGKYFEDPPQVELTTPSREALQRKDEWERDRLDAWLGA